MSFLKKIGKFFGKIQPVKQKIEQHVEVEVQQVETPMTKINWTLLCGIGLCVCFVTALLSGLYFSHKSNARCTEADLIQVYEGD